MSSRLLLVTAAACLALAACSTSNKRIGQDDPLIGEAVRYNAAIQTINPDPVYPEDAAQPGDNGAVGAAAARRYRTDQTNARHKADTQQTRGLSTTGGSGGPQ